MATPNGNYVNESGTLAIVMRSRIVATVRRQRSSSAVGTVDGDNGLTAMVFAWGWS
jgi:hypothetical protein